MELLAHARITMWEGGALWVVDATPTETRETKRTDPHAHHAIQITLSLGGQFRLKTPSSHVDGNAIAVAPDSEHTFEAEGLVAILFIEPESREGRAVTARLFDGHDLAVVPPALLGTFRDRIAALYRMPSKNDAAFIDIGKALIAHMAGNVRGDIPDLRIRKVLAWANQQIEGPVSLTEVVPLVNLSAGRLRHLFVEQTGLPFKTYLLWLRLTRAAECFAGGASLTKAAHEAGFADSAHLSRTFRRMFGVAPAALRLT